jgi:diguanylate cyclase (GGDEF)-like protein
LKRADGKIFGMISAQSYQPHAYTKEDQEFLELLAAHAATALENTRLFAEVQKLATIDPLTGINNRRELFIQGRQEFERAQRYHRPLSAIMLDLDHFKKVNDTHGHSIGDQVLTCVAKRCAHSLREVDILGRYGGEEFAILLPESGLEAGVQAANRLRDIIRSTPCPTDAGPIPITISLGVATIDSKCRDLESLLDRADQALYEAKQSGRDRVCTWKE